MAAFSVLSSLMAVAVCADCSVHETFYFYMLAPMTRSGETVLCLYSLLSTQVHHFRQC